MACIPDGALLTCFAGSISTPREVYWASLVDKRCRSLLLESENAIWSNVLSSICPAAELSVQSHIDNKECRGRDPKALVSASVNTISLRVSDASFQGKHEGNFARSGHVSCILDDNFLVTCFGLGRVGLKNDAHQPVVVDLNTMKLVQVEATRLSGSLPVPRLRGTLTSCTPSSALLFGGSSHPGRFLGDLWMLTSESDHKDGLSLKWQELVVEGEIPDPRAHHAAVALNRGRELAIFGGSSTAHSALAVQLEVLEVAMRRWRLPRQSGLFPPPMTQLLAFAQSDPNTGVSSRVFVFGGCLQNTLGATFYGPLAVFSLELATMVWSRLPPDPLTPPLCGRVAGCPIGGGSRFLVLGGDMGGRLGAEPRIFDLDKSRWKKVATRSVDKSGISTGLGCAGHTLNAGVLLGGYDLEPNGRIFGPVCRLWAISLDPWPENGAADQRKERRMLSWLVR